MTTRTTGRWRSASGKNKTKGRTVNAEGFDVKAFVSDLPKSYLECRGLGHNWRPHTASRIQGGWEEIVKCSICKGGRRDVISLTGEVVSRTYIHPANFLAKGAGKSLNSRRGVFRVERLTRLNLPLVESESG